MQDFRNKTSDEDSVTPAERQEQQKSKADADAKNPLIDKIVEMRRNETVYSLVANVLEAVARFDDVSIKNDVVEGLEYSFSKKTKK